VSRGRSPAFDAPELGRRLEPLIGAAGEAALVVALSGGADSVALLAAATELCAARRAAPEPRLRLRAIYVDHGLTAAAPLAAAASAAAERLGVPLVVLRVEVETGHGESVEAAARTARYAALAAALAPGECLLTAHHREDQAETLLLQLVRGAGLRGLAAMPAAARLGHGSLLRPLLDVPRAALRSYAASRGLAWHEDPMNADPRFDRAYLRGTLWPLLEARWPAAAATIARSAGHLASAQRLLDEASADHLRALGRGPALSIAGLKELSPERRTELLRYWLRSRRLPLPPARRLALLAEEVFAARGDGAPKLAWPGAELRRFDGRLYAFAPLPPLGLAPGTPLPAPPGALELGALGRIVARWQRGPATLDVTATGGLAVAGRRGGERLRLVARGPSRPLKDWLREARVPPWTRARAVLVHEGEALVAVVLPHATLIEASRRAPPDAPGLALHWQGAPEVLAPSKLIEPRSPFL
jgi:tRNA(Ile)-lysidine synthase